MGLRCLFEGRVLVFVFSAANVASKDLGRAAATGAVAPPKREKVSWILELSLRVIFLVAFLWATGSVYPIKRHDSYLSDASYCNRTQGTRLIENGHFETE